jgi:hypothetical protein
MQSEHGIVRLSGKHVAPSLGILYERPKLASKRGMVNSRNF